MANETESRREIADLQARLRRLTAEVADLSVRLLEVEKNQGVEVEERKPATILVCDDTRLVRAMIRGILESARFRVLEAENGSVALAVLEEQGADLVIVDIHMPDVDGVEFLKQMRASNQNAELPVIVCSGSRERDDYIRIGKHGVQGVLQKPIKRQDLLDRVESALDGFLDPVLAIDSSVFDVTAALGRVGGDERLLKEMAQTFLDESSSLMATVRKAVVGENAEALRDSAHSLKGAFLSLGGVSAAENANLLEALGAAGDLSTSRDRYRALEQAVLQLRDALGVYLRTNADRSVG